MALSPQRFLRFKGTQDFQEVAGIPQGEYNLRGPQESWPRDTTDVFMYLPSEADRIEVYWWRDREVRSRPPCSSASTLGQGAGPRGLKWPYILRN